MRGYGFWLMVIIKPFAGIQYKEPKGNICPPYDVIDESLYEELNKGTNFVKIILKGDHKDYTESRKLFEEWLKKGTLVKDEEQYYLILEEFVVGKQKLVRTGLTCLVKTDGEIFPHEKTFPKVKSDRMEHLKQTKLNAGQIFMIYEDDGTVQKYLTAQKKSLLFQVEDENNNIKFTVYGFKDPRLAEKFKDKSLLIADGHHRFEVAKSQEYAMCYLVSSKDTGLAIMATNRVVYDCKLPADFEVQLSKHFSVTEVNQNFDTLLLTQKPKGSIVCYANDKFLMLTPKNDEKLDVEILHDEIIGKIINGKVAYAKGKIPTFEKLQELDAQAAFFLNAPSFGDVYRIVSEGRLMPEKSTYFFPKIYSGLVFREI